MPREQRAKRRGLKHNAGVMLCIVGAGFRADIAVPLLKAGAWVATLAVYSIAPRTWTAAEAALVDNEVRAAFFGDSGGLRMMPRVLPGCRACSRTVAKHVAEPLLD